MKHQKSVEDLIGPASAAILKRIRASAPLIPLALLAELYDIGTKADLETGREPNGDRWRKIERGDEALSIGEYIEIERMAIAKGHITWTWADVVDGWRGHLSENDCDIRYADALKLFESGLSRLKNGQLPYGKGRPRKARCWSRQELRQSYYGWFTSLRKKGALLISATRDLNLFLSGQQLAQGLRIEFMQPLLRPYPRLGDAALVEIPFDAQRRLNSMSATKAFRWLKHDPRNWSESR
jgi:hypothetical protein